MLNPFAENLQALCVFFSSSAEDDFFSEHTSAFSAAGESSKNFSFRKTSDNSGDERFI
jgi:hypothetical protein